MTVTIKTRVALLVASIIALPLQAAAEFEPLAGKWERSLTTYMFMHSANRYAPWEHPKSSSCHSEAALSKLEFLSPASSKARLEKDGKSCEVSDERTVNASTSWRSLCRRPDGAVEDTTTTVATAATEIRLSSVVRVVGKYDDLGPDGMRVELLMRRIGDCDEKNSSKN